MSPSTKISVKNPLQLLGLYIGWMETVMAGALWATTGIVHWSRYALMISAALGIIAYIGTSCFIVVYLAVKKPHLLFNPSDYDKDVQKYLFSGEFNSKLSSEDTKRQVSSPIVVEATDAGKDVIR